MTHFNSSDRNVSRAIRSWLHEDRHEDASRLAGAILDRVETIPQRRATWWPARRTPNMTKFITYGLGAAAVVIVLLFGAQLFGRSNSNVGSGNPTPTATAVPTPSPSIESGGPLVLNDGQLRVTVDTASSGWTVDHELDYMFKNDDGLDPPESVGAGLIAWTWPAGTRFSVYGDPCHWSTTLPKRPVSTPDKIAAALAAQASTDASEPVDVNVGGYAGKMVTVHVPLSYDLPSASREEEFADCDHNIFGFYGAENDTEPARNAQGAGQIDELSILDVNGSIVILDAFYGPATPADLVDEVQALANSATFEAP